jgi:hypothetical protein
MKAFALLALLPLAACMPSHPAPAYGHPAPAYGHPAPAYGHPAPAYGHPAPAYGHHAGYGYEQPKHNCSVVDVVEPADVCTPTIAKSCADVTLDIKLIESVEQCYTVTRTVCTESIEIVPNEVCSYSYEPKSEETTGKTVEVAFTKESKTQMVTVCQPGYGGYGHGGYGGYGHQYCNEVAQETQYNVPSVPVVEPPVTVVYPNPVKTCVDKPISLPKVTCADLSEEKCIQVPAIKPDSITVAKCTYALGEPACQKVELTLPKQVCVELVYGYAHEEKHHAPAEH